MDKRIKFNDIEGFYSDEGKGEVMMLVHGFCEDGSVWDGFTRELSKTHRLLIPDLPGYRNSTLSNEALSVDGMAGFIKAILDHENITQATIIGHSMGGYITLALVDKFPRLAVKIGLFHSHCFADDDEKKQNRQKGIDFVGKNGTREFVSELYGNLFAEKFIKEHPATFNKMKARAQQYAPETIIEGLRAMKERPDRCHVLKSFKGPVLFILGKQDKAIPYKKSVEQCSYPDISSVHIIDECGHMGMIEEPQKTLEIVREFANLNVS